MKSHVGVSIDPLVLEMVDLQEILEVILAEDVGFENIELHAEYLDDYIDIFLKLLENTGLRYTLHAPHDARKKVKVKLCSSISRDIEFGDYWLSKSIEFAKKLDIKLITIHPDRPVKCIKNDAKGILKQHVMDALNHMDKDMFLLLENMPSGDYTMSNPQEMKDFIDEIGSKQIGFTWDVAHSILATGDRFLEFPKILRKYIKNVHLCDIRNKKDHFPLGTGRLNLPIVINSLSKIRYSGIINLEIFTTNILDIINSKNIVEKLLKEERRNIV